MRCQQLVGRTAELVALEHGVAAARAGQGSWTTLLGEAGIGKSRLAAELAAWVGASGGQAVVGRCSAVDRATPFRPLAEVLLGTTRGVDRPDAVAALQPYLPAVERFVPHWRRAGPGLVSESPAIVGESIVQVLSWLAGDDAVLVVLEDLHWADAGTVTVCDYLADHLGGTRLVVVATARDGELPPSTAAVLRRRPAIRLQPLSRAEVAEVAAGCLSGPAPADVLERLQRFAGGLPLLVEDLLGDDGSSRFDDLVKARLDSLTPAAKRLVVAAALVGERFDWLALADSLGTAPADHAAVMHQATAAQLVVPEGGGFRFRHALTRDAVLAASPALAATLAAPVAQSLEGGVGDGDLARAAELWAGVDQQARATDLFQRAAEAAAGRGAPTAALDLLERAAALAPDQARRTAIDLARLHQLVSLGRVAAAVSVGEALLDTDADGATVHRLLARACLGAGQVTAALAHLDAVREGSERLVLRASATLATSVPDRRIIAEHLAHQAVAAAQLEHEPAVACEALEIVARCARSRSLAEAEAALRRALSVADGASLPALRLRLLNELGTVEMLRAADGRRLYRAYDEAQRAGALDVAVGTQVNIAALHAMRGELDQARDAAERAEEAARRLGIRPLLAAALVMNALSDGFRGRYEPMDRRIRAAQELVPDDADLRAFAWGAGRGLCALLREDRDVAIDAFRRAIQPDPPVGSLDTAHGPLALVLAASGAATSDDLAAARATATPGAGWSDLWVGYAAAAMGGGLAAFGPADAAGRRHPIFRAIGLRLLAEAAMRDGWGNPVGWLRDAEATFVAGGQDRIATACRSLLRKAGAPAARRRGADRELPPNLLRSGVTAREAEVLALVGERLSNKEIATRLFLSARTVEKHVASLLTKLEAPDRATLARVARDG